MSLTQKRDSDLRLKVLLVEDEAEIRALLCEILEDELNIDIVEAGSAIEAWEIFQREKFDLVISDIQMPGGVSGLHLTEKIVKQDMTIPVVILTAHEDKERIHTALQLGATDYLVKPILGEYLVERLKRAIEKRKFFLLKEKNIDVLYDVLNTTNEGMGLKTKIKEKLKQIQEIVTIALIKNDRNIPQLANALVTHPFLPESSDEKD